MIGIGLARTLSLTPHKKQGEVGMGRGENPTDSTCATVCPRGSLRKSLLTLLDSVTLHSSYFTVNKHIQKSKWSISFWEHPTCGAAHKVLTFLQQFTRVCQSLVRVCQRFGIFGKIGFAKVCQTLVKPVLPKVRHLW